MNIEYETTAFCFQCKTQRNIIRNKQFGARTIQTSEQNKNTNPRNVKHCTHKLKTSEAETERERESTRKKQRLQLFKVDTEREPHHSCTTYYINNSLFW